MEIPVIHLGYGRVGKELILQINKFEKAFESRLGISLKFYGFFRSKTQFIPEKGLSASEVLERGENEFALGNDLDNLISRIKIPFILLDTSASEFTFPYLVKALKKGGFVVMSNKKPLSGSLKNFQKLMELGENRIFFETVVGAGLPIIKTLKEMFLTGDEVLKIEGSFSGTLGFIFSELEKGRKFSEVVIDAKEKGFTEPDPRDDLSGMDVARKVLILSRLLGYKTDLKDIKLSGLVPGEMNNCSVKDFLDQLPKLDDLYKKKIKKAKSSNKALRFLGMVSGGKSSAGLEEIDVNSDAGMLRGPDNITVIQSRRYYKNPLVIKGPGAGIEVTAAGVFADILEAIKVIKSERKISEFQSPPAILQ